MKKQFIIISFLAILLSMITLDIFAYSAKIDGIYYNFSDTKAIVTCQNYNNSFPSSDYKGNIVIPESVTYEGVVYSVISIGEGAFYNCTGLTSVTIPNSVTSIGNGAFCSCKGLKSVTIPNSVTTIGNKAFGYCDGLTSVTIPNSVTSIGEYAFFWCSALKSVTIPNSVTSIGDGAFSKCSKIATLNIDCENVGVCFSGVKTLTELNLGEHVKKIEDNAFGGCSGLTSVTIPNSVTTIGGMSFYNCSGLTSVTIGNGVTSIEDDAFWGCSCIKKLILNSNGIASKSYHVKSTINEIFGSHIEECVIGESVTSIGNYAFGCNYSLKSVTIPSSVTSIGELAFHFCDGLTSVNITDLDAWCKIKFAGASSNPLNYAHHLFMDGKEITDLVIPNSVTSIGDYAFGRCYSLKSVTIPSSVTSIGNDAFCACDGLTSVHITDLAAWCNIKFSDYLSTPLYYAHYLFMDGKEITDLVVPNSVTSIGNFAFAFCSGLKSVTFPNSVTSIGVESFQSCSGLTSVAIPNSVTSIGGGAFQSCSGLTSLTIPNSVTSIGSSAFSGCSSLTSIIIPNSVTSIRDNAFSGCSGLTSVTIGNSVTSIGDNAFSGCFGLTSVTIPNSVTTIGSAFSGCSGLTSVTIGNSVTSIGYSAFFGCSGLTSVTIPNSVTSIGNRAFHGCSGLTSVTIGNCVTSIEDEAFTGCSRLDSVIALAVIPPFISDYSFSDYSVPLIVPKGCKEAYQHAQGWKKFTNIIAEGMYKLTYVVDGDEYKSYEIEGGTSITPEPEPTKEGYTFSGWSEIPETMPSHNVTVTGTFTKNATVKYKLTYKVDGEVYKTYEMEEGATVTPEPAPTKEGYTFSGWSDIPQTMPNHDVTVTGTFTKNTTAKYKLTYKVDGEVYKTYEMEEGAAITPEPAPTKEGYTFSGWSEIPQTMPDHDVTVTGTFTKNATAKYILTYKVDGEVYKTYEMKEGAPITPEPAPTKDGYTFSGWSEIPQTMPDHDVTVTGTFIPNTPVEDVGYVDLGLPSGLLWATCNLGASLPEEVGGYYAWGETSPKTFFSQGNYKYKDKPISLNDISGTEYDAAAFALGGTWRMPTKEELMELANKCTREETTLNGKACMKFTGPNGNSLYLPKGGFGDEGNGLGLNGYGLWSSTKCVSSTAYRAWEWTRISNSNMWQGIPIRPVTSEKPTGSSTKFGDANGDGIVNTYDIIDIANYTMGKPTSTGTFNEKAADMNKDGVVNIADIVQIVNIIMVK